LPRIIDIVSSEARSSGSKSNPIPERLMRYGITLDQLQKAISESNANVGGDYLIHGEKHAERARHRPDW